MSKAPDSASRPPRKRRLGALLSLLVACAFTAALFWYLARTTTLEDWIGLYRGLPWGWFAAFLMLFLGSMLLKAMRYRVLLTASGETIRYWHLVVITFVSNLFVDLLPARSGSLAYIVFLNRKLSVGLPAAFSSFAFSFIFDLIGMLPLFCLAIILHQAAAGGGEAGLWILLGLLGLIAVLALLLLEGVLALIAALVAWLAGRLGGKLQELTGRLAREVESIRADVARVKAQGVFWQVLLVSVAIRALKYLALYVLVAGLAAQWPAEAARLSFPLVLFALVAAEATASLPISGIAGFGAYEGVMMATLRSSGLAATQAALIPFGLHLLTQTVDYTLGGLALAILSLITRPQKERGSLAQQKRRNRIGRWIAIGVLAAMAAAGAIHFGPRYIYSFFGNLALSEEPSTMGEAQKAAIRAATKGLKARVVWSSSRSGSHEIYMLTLPELSLYRLTTNKYVDWYSRFSPDGKELVYARSQKPWVSERNLDLWDTYRLNLVSGRESLLAKNANYPQWVGRDAVSFLRRTLVVLKDLAGGGEKVLFDSAGPPIAGRVYTPELSPVNRNLLALTARGKLEGVFVYDRARKDLDLIGQGCQLGWFPGGRRLFWVENTGHGGTRIMSSPLKPVKPRVFMDQPGSHSHEYFPRFSADGRWMVWAASAGGHEHDIADYEIFLWDTTKPWDQAVRLTYNQANDRWPDIFVEK